ncbi:hypothetical protein KVR01_009654 [Diaporthe batatas]|uniref:uncharacterized protein n=1 Tax=Diaporthe batatas TaxID=748121 RepID=UPI001D049D23|nr:uncharacterized protein KVR01_009654 [Diaporthe batatas]KAG8160118.1 hypothetical protein KVR01_009654 [Diaporthe batatas]
MQPARPQLGGGRAPGSFAPLPRNEPSQGSSNTYTPYNTATHPSAASSNHNGSNSSNINNNRNQGDLQSFYPPGANAAAAAAAAAAASADLPPPQRPRVRRVESSSSEDSISIHIAKARSPTSQYNPQFPQQAPSPAPAGSSTPSYSQFTTAHSNSSTASLQNFSRPTPSPLANAAAAAVAARSVAGSHDPQLRNASPLTLPPSTAGTGMSRPLGHSRKHSQNAGAFEPSLPSISTSNLSSYGSMSQQSPSQRDLPASHIAAQAAVLSHQQSQQMLQHSRQRSQTVPTPGDHYEVPQPTGKRGSGQLNPPVLSLTEASAPRETGFGSQGYHNGLLGSNAATTAANVVFPRSGQTSPISSQTIPQPPPPPPPLPEKKPEKSSKVKLFSRPGKIGTKGDSKDKPLPSPSKIGSALSALQRANFSTTSLDSTGQSFYNMANASSATIRPADPPAEKEAKEKKHHFLSRQRIKPKDKDDYHLQLSSAASNSRPTDPSAPSSIYNFNVPSSPGPNSGTFNSGAFKNISGLDLRHGGRALRHGRKEEKAELNESVSNPIDWAGPGSLGSTSAHPMYQEPIDSAKYGLNSMSLDDAWPYLRAKLLVIFEAEELKLPIEDFNRVVVLHLQYCIQRRSPNMVLEDLRSLLQTGFLSLDRNLLKGSEDRMIPALVDAWMAVFTHITPYLQAVFLPLDQEFAGNGTLMTPEQARDFWGGVIASSPAGDGNVNLAPASAVLDIRTLVLTSFRDVVILPRYEKLKTLFSRLSLEFLPGMALASPMQADTFMSTSPGAESAPGLPFAPQQRPGTAMSLDPSTASYNSTSTTLLGDLAAGGRSRGLSNVSFASSGAHSNGGSDSLNMSSAHSLRPPKLTPGNSSLSLGGGGGAGPGSSSTSLLGLSLREQNVEDSKQVTEMVGRMLQCMSVLAGTGQGGDEGTMRVQELTKLLKLNWLGRGRTGRNRRGIVGGRVARGNSNREEVSVA